MKSLLLAALSLLALTDAPAGWGQVHPGLQPYSPTRIEWFALLMDENFRKDWTSDSPFSLRILVAGPETLAICVRYLPRIDQQTRDVMNMEIESAKASIKAVARSRGWGWIKVRQGVKDSLQKDDEGNPCG